MAESGLELLSKRKKEKNGSQSSLSHESGLTILTSCLFVVGEMTGSGILALPSAVAKTGWAGPIIIVVCACISAFTGTILGKCWIMLLDNVKPINKHCANPYPTIGFYAFGNIGKHIVNISVYFTLFGVCVVLLIIASGNVQNLMEQVNIELSICLLVIIIGCVLAPVCWLKSPKDFWPVALMASGTTAVASVLIIIQSVMDANKTAKYTAEFNTTYNVTSNESNQMTFKGFFITFGTVLFCFGGMAAFPTIQADMKRPEKFTTTVVVAITTILLMYVPVATVGFSVYGVHVKDNIFESLSKGPLLILSNILITVHLISAYIILQNPLSQVLEQPFSVKDELSVKRILIRSIITVFVIFVALSCPKFSSILSLVGGSAITLNTFVFPSVFYLKLCSDHKNEWTGTKVSSWEWLVHILIVFIGVIGGLSSTYSAVQNLAQPNALIMPCYIKSMQNITMTKGH